VLGVRIEAASLLAAMPQDSLPLADRERLSRAINEYVKAQRVNADRPEHRLNLGNLYLQQHRLAETEAEYTAARALDPGFTPVYVSLAQLYAQQRNDTEGERVLRQALSRMPNDAELHHALGLNLVRQRRAADALPELASAAVIDSANPRYAYVYAIALNSTGHADEAITTLETSHARHPADRDTLFALVTINRDAGRPDAALFWADRLATIDPSAKPLVDQLRQIAPPR
jgi:tetratricopeptide (TPR) repeat protein